MWTYVVLILFPLIIQHISFGENTVSEPWYRKKTEISMKFFWVFLQVLLLVRHDTLGIDLSTYEDIFIYLSESNWMRVLLRSPEVAWSIMNKVVALLGGGFRWIMIISAVLSTFWISKAYIKYSDDPSLSISIFIVLSNFILLFSGLRQAIAISLGFAAFEQVKRKQFLPFVLITLIAILFHISAFMLIFMYPLYHTQIRTKTLLFILPILAAVFVFNQQIFLFLGLILNQFTDYDTSISKTGSITMLILFALLTVFSFIIPDESQIDEDTLGMRNFLLLSVVIQMFAPLHSVAMRMGYYYIAFIPLVIPRVINCRSERWAQVAIVARYVMVVFFIIYFFATSPADNLLHTFPYRFFWEENYS